MEQIYSTRRLIVLKFAVAVRKVFLNRSSDKSFYVIDLSLVSFFFFTKTEFFP